MTAEQNGTPALPHQGLLAQFFKDWQQAAQRAVMAEQSYLGAKNDAVLKEARFKGAAELIYGPDYTFEYNEKDGLRFKPPNQAARREIARKARKK